VGREDFRKENINEKSFLGHYTQTLYYILQYSFSFCLDCCFMCHTYAQKKLIRGSSRNSIYAIIEYLCSIHKSVYVYPTKTLNCICHLNFNIWDNNAKTNNEKSYNMPPFIIILNVPSASTSFIMSWSSASVGFWPSDRMTVPNSLVVIVPSPSLSNNEKASLNSAICSSVNWSAWKLEIDIGYLYQFCRGIVIVIKFIAIF